MSLEETLAIEQTSGFDAPIVDRPISPARDAAFAKEAASPTAAATTIALRAPSPVATWPQRILAALSGGSIFRKSMLALVDQGVVSAVNFLTMVLIRRTTAGLADSAEHELGLYQLGFSIVLLATCIQNALISTPYAVFGNRMLGQERKRYAGSTLIHQGLLSALAVVVLLAAGFILAAGWKAIEFDEIALILAVVAPFLMVREFVRRLAFVHLQVLAVLLLDLAVAGLQIGGLLALKATGNLTTLTTFCTMGAACAVAGLAALYFLRGHFSMRATKTWPDLRMNWSFGRWAFAAQVVYLVMAYLPSWMLAFLAGTQATGRFAVGMSLVMIANPLLIGLYNFLGPQAIFAYHNEGLAALRRLTIRIGVIVTAAVSLLFVLLVVGGGTLLIATYGSKVQGQEQVITILALSMVMYALSISAENGLIALNRPQSIFWANVVGLIVVLVSGCLLIGSQGIIGAALAALVGTIAATIFKVLRFFQVSRVSTVGSVC
jgi:O-antigen/teichoic acid export membrane protein